MERRSRRQPDEWVVDGWDLFDEPTKEWYKRYADAVYWGNFEELQRLCDEAPSKEFERLREEIRYELDSWSRRQYTVPKSRLPRYSELDYGWDPPLNVNIKEAVNSEYYGEYDQEMYRPSKRRKKNNV